MNIKLKIIYFILIFICQGQRVYANLANISLSNESIFSSINDEDTKENVIDKKINRVIQEFNQITEDRAYKLKPENRPFILMHGLDAPTAVMIHGLSDSPLSMREISKVYFDNGYNVLTVLLRDHGLKKEYRNAARAKVTTSQWREDVDKVMMLALKISNGKKIALAGYSLGGALTLDTAHRYAGNIASMIFIAPLFQMKHNLMAEMTPALRHVKFSFNKGVSESKHFYPDIALNQTAVALRFIKYLKNQVVDLASDDLLGIKKGMFLIDNDQTVENEAAVDTAKNIGMDDESIVLYHNVDDSKIVLHRDLPMKLINSNSFENPHLNDLLLRLGNFLRN